MVLRLDRSPSGVCMSPFSTEMQAFYTQLCLCLPKLRGCMPPQPSQGTRQSLPTTLALLSALSLLRKAPGAPSV